MVRSYKLPRATGRTTRFVFPLGLAALILLAGCGPDEGGGGTGPELQTAGPENDPCSLVTATEAEQILGASAEAERPGPGNNDYMATCRYVAPRGQGVAVLVVSTNRGDGSVGFRNAKRMSEQGIVTEPVAGLGDDAFWVGDPLHTLYVLNGTDYVNIGGDVELDQVKPLAAAALERMN